MSLGTAGLADTDLQFCPNVIYYDALNLLLRNPLAGPVDSAQFCSVDADHEEEDAGSDDRFLGHQKQVHSVQGSAVGDKRRPAMRISIYQLNKKILGIAIAQARTQRLVGENLNMLVENICSTFGKVWVRRRNLSLK